MHNIFSITIIKKHFKTLFFYKKKKINNIKKTRINQKIYNKNKKIKYKKNINKFKNDIDFHDKDPLSCKEYKILGICAYGNSCKFMHDRKVLGYCNIKY
mmetsp:Transcript_19328/g.39132  ORF Transcript_19328/g.39132 Transcript_19328/m.39132 type:complete len:99 (-) Transcript_19328:246-542(-)